ncbi:MAG: biotin/lipoyl-containing protein [Candidatus Zixiibacteriota bacterium]
MPRYIAKIKDREYDITLDYLADRVVANINGQKREVVVHRLRDTRSLVLIDNRSYEVDIRSNGAAGASAEKIVFLRGRDVHVTVENYALAQMNKAAGKSSPSTSETSFRAPMPGLVVQIRVQPEQEIKVGDPLIVIEAMKMENILKARTAGVVRSVPVAVGKSVEKGDILVEFE